MYNRPPTSNFSYNVLFQNKAPWTFRLYAYKTLKAVPFYGTTLIDHSIYTLYNK